MKNIVIAIVLISVLSFAGLCSYVIHRINNPSGISVSVNESKDTYRFYARYDRFKTGRVKNFLREQLHSDLFRRNRIDAYLTLDDQTHVHVKSIPGRLLILLNKKENDFEAYYRIKQLGEGLKHTLTRQ